MIPNGVSDVTQPNWVGRRSLRELVPPYVHYLTSSVDDIRGITVLQTYLGGKRVYEKK